MQEEDTSGQENGDPSSERAASKDSEIHLWNS